MMENRPSCRRWVTTNQDEFQNPACVRVVRNIDSAEIARYETCMEKKAACEEQLRRNARETLCNTEQEMNREPVLHPTDSHIDECVKCTKPAWCRCLATGDPNCYEEYQDERTTDELCCCKEMYKQMEPTPDNDRQKTYSSTYFIDYRDPDYNYIASKALHKDKLDSNFREYKAKADAEDLKKEPKIMPPEAPPEDRVDPNCMGLYDSLPPEKVNRPWKADESWWRNETPECVKNLVKKYIWTSTYREMNKDGAALPITKRELPATSMESPPGDPMRHKPEMAPCTMYHLGDVFERWDRPQIRTVAGRCDTIYNRPCLEYDTYFKDHYLHRAKFARCAEVHDTPSAENLRLVREERLRIPYDRTIPGYMGYQAIEVPPICKVKKPIDFTAPDTDVSTYQLNYTRFPQEVYDSAKRASEAFKPLDFGTTGINSHPIFTLSRIPLPPVSRLSCYLECGQCQTAQAQPCNCQLTKICSTS